MMEFLSVIKYLKTIRKLRKELTEAKHEIHILRKENQEMYDHLKGMDERLMEVL